MKRIFLIILCVCLSNKCLSQIHEAGFFIGGTNYIGDIGKTNYFSPSDVGSSLVYKFNVNTRIALRANYSNFGIKADDKKSNNAVRYERGYSFENDLHEIAVGIEYNFAEYDLMSRRNKDRTPYILLQVAVFDYNSLSGINECNECLFTKKTSVSIPVGIGYKARLSGNIAFAVETTFRYTFIDDLDYPSYPIDPINNMSFEGNSNDWYVFTGISLVYTFGRPSCYSY